MKNTLPSLPLENNNGNTPFQNPSETFPSRDEVFLQRIEYFLKQNLGNQCFGVKDLANAVHLSVSQLNRRLNSIGKNSGGKLIILNRLNKAAHLLAKDTGTIAEIANQTGFSSQAHFSRSFKKAFYCTPSQYRRKYYKKD